jgi:hypothetical protein
MDDKCNICGKPAIVFISGSEDGECYCQNCYNKMTAEEYDIEIPDIIPETVSVADDKGNLHTFRIRFMLWGHINTLEAEEADAETQYACHLYGEPDKPFSELWSRLLLQIEHTINTHYIDDDGHFHDNKAIGYINYNDKHEDLDIVIDGKSYSWEDLKKNVNSREGWRIKIEFAESEEELE